MIHSQIHRASGLREATGIANRNLDALPSWLANLFVSRHICHSNPLEKASKIEASIRFFRTHELLNNGQ
jgi:hypothetical protein